MKTIILLSTGEYSDYRIVAACSSMEKYEETKKILTERASDTRFNAPETFVIDEIPINTGRELLRFWVEITPGGDVIKTASSKDPLEFNSWDPISLSCEYVSPGGYIPVLNVGTWAKDLDHAIKIANERRIAYLASPNIRHDLNNLHGPTVRKIWQAYL